jgi:hypothetical protein
MLNGVLLYLIAIMTLIVAVTTKDLVDSMLLIGMANLLCRTAHEWIKESKPAS